MQTIGSRCEPNSVIKAAAALSREAKSVVRDWGFGAFLNMKIKKLYCNETIMVLMDKSDVSSAGESFTIVLSDDNKLEVTPEFVKRCFHLPAGEKSIEDKNWTDVYIKFWTKLKDREYDVVTKVLSKNKYQDNKKLPYQELVKYITQTNNKYDKAKVFCMILLSKLLMPTQSNMPTKKHVGLCSYIDSKKSYNWCSFICQDLKHKITAWQKREKKPSKIEGCTLLLLVSPEHKITISFTNMIKVVL